MRFLLGASPVDECGVATGAATAAMVATVVVATEAAARAALVGMVMLVEQIDSAVRRIRDKPSCLRGSALEGPNQSWHSRYKIVFHVKALLWESIILSLSPPPAKPTLLQYYRTTNAQYTLPHRPPPLLPCTIQYW